MNKGVAKKSCGEKNIDVDFYKKVGQAIRYYRYANFLKQEEVSEKLAISFQQLQKYETGVNRIPVDILIKLAELFKVTINDLIEFVEPNDDMLTTDVEFLSSLEESYLLSRYIFYKRGVNDMNIDLICQKLKITPLAYENYESGKLGLQSEQILKVLKFMKISCFAIANQDKTTKKLSLDSTKLQEGIKNFRILAQSQGDNVSPDNQMLRMENNDLKEKVQKIHNLEKENAELKFQNNAMRGQIETLKERLAVVNNHHDGDGAFSPSKDGFAVF